ncbi:MAG: hypothetical protein ABIT08_11435 [Bacteroidia bacterium]
MDTYKFFSYASNIVEAVPVIAGIVFYKKEKTKYRLFMFYLLYGFLTDTVKPFLTSDVMNRIINHIYSLIETPFLLWFIGQGITNKKIKALVLPAMILSVLLWFYCHFIHETSALKFSALYDNVSCLLVAAAAAYSLLIMTHDETNIAALPDFWFLTGIFFYFFIAGFLFNFIESDLLKRVWFIHNIISILSLLILTKAFFVIGKQQPATSNR